MSSDSFNANETCFSFNWPSTLSGIERVALSAKGDLQRTLRPNRLHVHTSTVTMTSPAAAQLVLVDKYPIGQVFRALGTGPAFQLLDVGLTEGGKGLWRVYTLKTDEFQCRIREEFPDRAMFHCDNWLDLPAQSVANRLPAVVDSGKSVVAH
ncbi:hypothetical protein RHS01_09307 [Rhizoctonia solani]|uniref:Uncharacterized protein n=1 Tax=Rhizoctonia solani TaxID=456999 RepID=A0A8H7M172_9AGAM|nr:hypothetical protein RHS01_09307 [Rhizoctonia solani]